MRLFLEWDTARIHTPPPQKKKVPSFTWISSGACSEKLHGPNADILLPETAIATGSDNWANGRGLDAGSVPYSLSMNIPLKHETCRDSTSTDRKGQYCYVDQLHTLMVIGMLRLE